MTERSQEHALTFSDAPEGFVHCWRCQRMLSQDEWARNLPCLGPSPQLFRSTHPPPGSLTKADLDLCDLCGRFLNEGKCATCHHRACPSCDFCHRCHAVVCATCLPAHRHVTPRRDGARSTLEGGKGG